MRRGKFFKALALTAVLGGVGASYFAPSAQAVQLSQTGLGDVLIFPYYTVRDGWLSLINVTNTSDVTVAITLRFHEGRNTRDALDFKVVLSPRDTFAGFLRDVDGQARFFRANNDTTCTVPPVPVGGQPVNPAAFSEENNDGGPTDIARTQEGYIVVMALGHATAGTQIAIDSTHVPGGAPTNCAGVVNAFSGTGGFTGANLLSTARQFGEPINSLKGSYSFLNPQRGVSAGGEAVTLANMFGVTGQIDGTLVADQTCTIPYNPNETVWNPGGFNSGAAVAGSCPNLITLQTPDAFLFPTLNDAVPAVSFVPDNDIPGTLFGFGPQFGFQAVSEVLRATSIVNEWSVNPLQGVLTDWVVTMPTKAFFVDIDDINQAMANPLRFQNGYFDNTGTFQAAFDFANPPGAVPPFDALFSEFNPGQSCIDVGVTVYDREENVQTFSGGTVSFSPAPPAPKGFCFETNVIQFSEDSVFGTALVATQERSSVADVVNALLVPFGWMELDLTLEPTATAAPPSILGGPGLPVAGFRISQRSFGPASRTSNYADLVDHAYRR